MFVIMYHSHDIARWLSLGIRDIAIASPHALKDATIATWSFIANFFHHALYGSTVSAEVVK
jgi:hypothetical protein